MPVEVFLKPIWPVLENGSRGLRRHEYDVFGSSYKRVVGSFRYAGEANMGDHGRGDDKLMIAPSLNIVHNFIKVHNFWIFHLEIG